MSDFAKLRAELRAGLDGVTPGPWEMIPAGNRPEVYASTRQAWGHELLCRVESLNPVKDAQHLARCSPENIAALLDALDAAERERDDLRLRVAELEGTIRYNNTVIDGYRRDHDALVEATVAIGRDVYVVERVRRFAEQTKETVEKLKGSIAELERRIAVGPHNCPDWDGLHIRPCDPKMECCTCRPEQT